MSIISFRDHENNRWKRKEEKKTEKNIGVTQAIMKEWKLNDIYVPFL